MENQKEAYLLQTISVDPKQEPIRIDKFLMDRLERMTRNRLQKAIKDKLVLVNEKEVKPNYKVNPGDCITIYSLRKPSDGDPIKGEDIALDIVYEDEAVLVIDKEAGMVVHPGIGNTDGTLVHALVHHLSKSNLPILPGNLKDRPGIVHRIDKETSGLLVIAKTQDAMSHLAHQFKNHSIERKYTAIVWGVPDPLEGTINTYIGRHPKNRLLYQSYDASDKGKQAITHYKVCEDLYYVSVVECQLETGRTHQIRVHMEAEGNPIFNDKRYGGDKIRKGTVFTKYKQFVQNCLSLCARQCLHASVLGFEHPVTGQQMRFKTQLPQDMSLLLDKWRTYVSSRKELL